MKTIEIDDQTYNYLGTHAIPFVETPGDTVKRLLGLSREIPSQIATNVEENGNKKNDIVKPLPKRGRSKRPKTNLPELIRAGLLKNGQTLVLRDYKGNDYPEYHVVISNGSLVWENREYSMSDLAQTLLKKHGYEADSVRGPFFWIIDNGKSIFELWKEYSEN